MAAIILWMGIGSPFFTRRIEASAQNVLQLMQRPQAAYDAGVVRGGPEMNSMNLNRFAMPANGNNAGTVNSK